jgi:hypothetical protein
MIVVMGLPFQIVTPATVVAGVTRSRCQTTALRLDRDRLTRLLVGERTALPPLDTALVAAQRALPHAPGQGQSHSLRYPGSRQRRCLRDRPRPGDRDLEPGGRDRKRPLPKCVEPTRLQRETPQ